MSDKGTALRPRLLVVAALSVLAGCGPAQTAAPAPARLGGTLTVLAAASLESAFSGGAAAFESAHPGVSLRLSFAGSQQLVQNVLDGAPADVVVTADTNTMRRLVVARLVQPPRTLVRNLLAIAVAPGNPRHIGRLSDLAAPGLDLVLADPSVPAGNYAQQVLRSAGVSLTPRSLELSVTAALEKVASRNADAAIVYATDVAAAHGSVGAVSIPAAENVIATYQIAVVTAGGNPRVAAAFVDDALTGRLHDRLLAAGFLTP